MSDWPSPPLYEAMLFENFWPGVAVLGAVGIILLIFTWRRRQRGLLIAAAVCGLLAGGNVLLTRFVTTNREALRARNIRLVEAYVAMDTDALGRMLGDQVQFQIVGDPVGDPEPREELMELAQRMSRRYQIAEWTMLGNNAAEVDGRWRSYMMVNTRVKFDDVPMLSEEGAPLLTEWQLTWRQEGDRWRLVVIDWLSLNREQPPRNAIK